MNFVNKKNCVGHFFQGFHNGLDSGLEIPAISRAGQYAAHVQGKDARIEKWLGNAAIGNSQGKSLGQGSFAHARVTDKERIVLAAPAQHLNGPVKLLVAANQRVNLSFPGPGRQVLGKFGKRIIAGAFVIFVIGPGAARAIAFFHVMGDKVQDIKAFDALLAQIILRVAVFLVNDGNDQVAQFNKAPAGRAHMHKSAFKHALHAVGLGYAIFVG